MGRARQPCTELLRRRTVAFGRCLRIDGKRESIIEHLSNIRPQSERSTPVRPYALTW